MSRQQVDTLEARVAGLATDADAADAQRDQAAARVATLQQRIDDATITRPSSRLAAATSVRCETR